MTHPTETAALIAQREYASLRAVLPSDKISDHLRHQWPDMPANYRELLISCVLAGMAYARGL